MKLKTHKSIAKRVKLTGAKRKIKLMRKRAGQNHFNSRDTGAVTQKKRRTSTIKTTDEKNILQRLPYR